MRRGGYNLLVMVPAQFGVNKRKIGGRAHLLSETASLRRLCGWVNPLSFVGYRWMVPSFALSLQMLGQEKQEKGHTLYVHSPVIIVVRGCGCRFAVGEAAKRKRPLVWHKVGYPA